MLYDGVGKGGLGPLFRPTVPDTPLPRNPHNRHGKKSRRIFENGIFENGVIPVEDRAPRPDACEFVAIP